MLTDDEIAAIKARVDKAIGPPDAPYRPVSEAMHTIRDLLADRLELLALIRRWSAAHDAARACPQMILSSGRTDEAAALMRECDAADEVLRAAAGLRANRG